MSPASIDENFEESSRNSEFSPSPTTAAPRSRPLSAAGQIDRNLVRKARDHLVLARVFRDHIGQNATTYANDVYVFQGTRYVAVSDAELRRRIYGFLDRVRGLNKYGIAVPRIANVKEITSAFKALTLLSSPIAPPFWRGIERLPVNRLVVCSNGIVDVSRGTLQEATPELFALTALDYPCDPSCKPPRLWLEFLAQVFPDNPAAIDLLQEVFGYLLVADTSQQRIFMLHGPRRSGKGTILRVLTCLLGRGNVVATNLFSLGERFGLAPLLGPHVATIGDAGRLGNSGRALERLLSISGEDAVTVERKHDPEMWSGRLPVRFVIATNSISALADPHGALASRLLTIPFRTSFAGREDPTLTGRLAEELPGILNWAIDGWSRLHQRGRFESLAVAAPDNSMPADIVARVARFVAERCELGSAHFVSKVQLVEAWAEWSRGCAIPPADPARFGQALLELGRDAIKSAKGPREGNDRPPIYRGIGLRERPPEDG